MSKEIIESMAISLHAKLDRKNIFPPLYNDPESYVPSVPSNDNYQQKRIPNASLMCRRNVHMEAKHKGSFDMRVISKVTGIFWNNASFEEKTVYKKLFKRVNEIYHERKYSHLLIPTPSTPSKDLEETPMIYYSFSSPPTISLPLSITINNINPKNFFHDYQTNELSLYILYDTIFL
ncbi:hypothetical protein C1646_714851, partial [Rhizophagus diaphanus]